MLIATASLRSKLRRLCSGGWQASAFRLVAATALIPGLGSSLRAQVAPHDEPSSCRSAGGVAFVCGVRNVEDLAALYPTSWIIGSNAHPPSNAGDVLYLFHSRSRTREAIRPSSISVHADSARFPGCAGAPDFAKFQTYGLGYRAENAGHGTLLVINHGGRDTVEAFDVDQLSTRPHLTWVGCIPEPPQTFGDSVVGLSDGGAIVTSTNDPGDPDVAAKFLAGRPLGAVNEWHANTGWKPVAGTETLSYPNGILISSDEKTLYIAVSGRSQVVKLDRNQGKVLAKSIPFTASAVDNLRWSPDHTLMYAGGEAGTLKDVLACSSLTAPPCQVGAAVYAMNPDTLRYTVIVPPAMYGSFGMATGAVLEGKTLWVSSVHSDRVALYPLAEITGSLLQKTEHQQ